MRLPQLDILRAIAVVLVILCHKYANLFLPEPLEWLAFFGWAGVDLFFVLSGFLIAGLLFQEYKKKQKVDAVRFLARRAFKIYPAFFVLLLAEIAFHLKAKLPIAWSDFLIEATFLQNYLFGYSGNSHTWSLAVEEHFYLIVALVFLFLPKINKKISFTFVVIAISIFCLALRTYITLTYPFTLRTHGYPTHLRIDSLLFGVWLSYVFHFKPKGKEWMVKNANLLLGGGLVLLSPAFFLKFDHPYMTSLGFTLLYLGFGAILIYAITREMPEKGVISSILLFIAFIGQHSYSIYLWHLFSRAHLTELLKDKHWIQPASDLSSFLWYLAIALLFGIGMARVIEFPFLKLRDKYF